MVFVGLSAYFFMRKKRKFGQRTQCHPSSLMVFFVVSDSEQTFLETTSLYWRPLFVNPWYLPRGSPQPRLRFRYSSSKRSG